MHSSTCDSKRKIVLVLGGARSGKSLFAENMLEENEGDLCYLATGQAWDSEMKKRVSLHKSRRSKRWITIEEPIDIASGLQAGNGRPVLIDCLTLWVTNLMLKDEASIDDLSQNFNELAAALASYEGQVILVSNEVGHSVVPENAMARKFVDLSGILHQQIASLADEVYFVTAGLPHRLK